MIREKRFMRTIVLASTSPYRRQLLKQLEIPFEAATPLFEETIDQSMAPELLVKRLSFHKAVSLRERFSDALIIGADQVFVDSRGRILGKPKTKPKAVEQLMAMAGKTHTFYTGLTLFDSRSERHLSDCVTFSVTLKKLSESHIRSYVERENPVDCAGSFKIEGLGIALMEKMAGDDYTALIGLPLIRLTDFLEQFGVKVL